MKCNNCNKPIVKEKGEWVHVPKGDFYCAGNRSEPLFAEPKEFERSK